MKINKKASLKKFNTFNVSETANIIYEVEEISELKGILSDNKGQIHNGGIKTIAEQQNK